MILDSIVDNQHFLGVSVLHGRHRQRQARVCRRRRKFRERFSIFHCRATVGRGRAVLSSQRAVREAGWVEVRLLRHHESSCRLLLEHGCLRSDVMSESGSGCVGVGCRSGRVLRRESTIHVATVEVRWNA